MQHLNARVQSSVQKKNIAITVSVASYKYIASYSLKHRRHEIVTTVSENPNRLRVVRKGLARICGEAPPNCIRSMRLLNDIQCCTKLPYNC